MAKGFSLIEVILAVALFGIYATVLLGVLAYGNESAIRAADHARSVFLAEEGMEAIRSLRSASWDNLIDGQYGVTSTPAGWLLLPTDDKIGRFNRRLIITSPDSSTKKITSAVFWLQGNNTISTEISSLLTNWQFVSSTVCVFP